MPLLGFQQQFAALVESGAKRQTIRAYRKDGRDPKPGDRLYLYTGLRTAHARKLGEATCTKVRRCDIVLLGGDAGEPSVVLDLETDREWWPGDLRNPQAAERRFARADGFASYRVMIEWFKRHHGLPFEGLLIKWGEIDREPTS